MQFEDIIASNSESVLLIFSKIVQNGSSSTVSGVFFCIQCNLKTEAFKLHNRMSFMTEGWKYVFVFAFLSNKHKIKCCLFCNDITINKPNKHWYQLWTSVKCLKVLKCLQVRKRYNDLQHSKKLYSDKIFYRNMEAEQSEST